MTRAAILLLLTMVIVGCSRAHAPLPGRITRLCNPGEPATGCLPRGMPQTEKRVAIYLPMVQSVSVNGKALSSMKRSKIGDDTIFTVVDSAVEIETTPHSETIDLRVRNGSTNSIKVRWEDAVFVDFDQTSSAIGHRGIDSGPVESAPYSVIAPRTSIAKSVFPTNRLYDASTTVQVTDQSCAQACQQLVYQCMAGFNCSGYRSRQPYTGRNWAIYAIVEGIDAGLCERRCLDQGRACSSSCQREVTVNTGKRSLPIVPALMRKCSQDEDEFERIAAEADQGTYGALLPIEIGGTRREYMLNFQATLFEIQLGDAC